MRRSSAALTERGYGGTMSSNPEWRRLVLMQPRSLTAAKSLWRDGALCLRVLGVAELRPTVRPFWTGADSPMERRATRARNTGTAQAGRKRARRGSKRRAFAGEGWAIALGQPDRPAETVPRAGIEPTTSGLGIQRSVQLSYRGVVQRNASHPKQSARRRQCRRPLRRTAIRRPWANPCDSPAVAPDLLVPLKQCLFCGRMLVAHAGAKAP